MAPRKKPEETIPTIPQETTEPKPKRQYNRTTSNKKGVLCKFDNELYKALEQIAATEERDIDKQVIYFVKQAIKKPDPVID